MSGQPTAGQLVHQVKSVLATAGIDDAEFDARCLVAEVLFGGDLNRLVLERSQVADETQRRALQSLVQRRAGGEPLQCVVGYTEFMGLRLRCDARALIPRPETELLVERILGAVQALGDAPRVAADIGTGSGAIAVALAVNLPRLHIYATDVSTEALSLAAENIKLHNLQECITLLEGPDLQPLWEAGVAGRVEVIATNPPYVSVDEWATLPPQIHDYEPQTALVDVSGSRLGFYRRIIPDLGRLPALRLFGCEVADGMGETVKAMVTNTLANWVVHLEPDYSGINRTVVAYVSHARQANHCN